MKRAIAFIVVLSMLAYGCAGVQLTPDQTQRLIAIIDAARIVVATLAQVWQQTRDADTKYKIKTWLAVAGVIIATAYGHLNDRDTAVTDADIAKLEESLKELVLQVREFLE